MGRRLESRFDTLDMNRGHIEFEALRSNSSVTQSVAERWPALDQASAPRFKSNLAAR